MEPIIDIRQLGIDTLTIEIDSLTKMRNYINDDFVNTISLLKEIKGRVVITGIGKSAIIAQKIVATMNSTGTPALFMHAADAIHGDLGMIQKEDAAIIISKSGESPEIKALVPFIKNFGNPTIAICGNEHSYLATHADYFLNTTVDHEACPNNLAPTTSTTAQLVMGDAIAVCLLKLKGFTAKDFAKFHPGGALGKRLYLHTGDVAKQNEAPKVDINADLKTIILEISSKRLGATAVVDGDQLMGIITDGDLRRLIEKEVDIKSITAKDFYAKQPKSIEADELAVNALSIIRENNISQLLVTENGIYVGMLHIHDLVREGLI